MRNLRPFIVLFVLTALMFVPVGALASHEPDDTWQDVPNDADEKPYIDWVHENEIFLGWGQCTDKVQPHLLPDNEECEPGTFGFRQGITRESMAVVLKNTHDNVTKPAIEEATTYDVQADGPYPSGTQLEEGSNSTEAWVGDNGAKLQESWVKCEEGKVATGGGFSPQHGSDDLGADRHSSLQIVTSAPLPGPVVEGDPDDSVTPIGWIVKGFNNSDQDEIVRPHVICVDL